MKTLKKVTIEPIFLSDYMPEVIEDGKLYISEQYGCAIHKCLCGCGGRTVTPLGKNGWQLIKHDDGKV